MPTNITATAEYVDETIQRAGPGEVGGMETGAAPLGPVLDRAFICAFYARAAVWGQLVWSGRLEVSGSAASPAVKVGPIDAVTLRATETRSGNNVQVWRPFYSATESTLGIAHVQGAPGALSADTWYYAYAFSNGTGTLQWQISTTPPTESGTPTVLQQWKRGQEANYRYLGCFRTDGSGNPIPVLATKGRYIYRRSAVTAAYGSFASGGLRAVDGTGTVALTALSLAARVPPHARIALLRGTVTMAPTTPGDDASASLRFFMADDANAAVPSSEVRAQASAATGATAQGDAELITTAAEAVGYAVVRVSSTASHAIDVLGWGE